MCLLIWLIASIDHLKLIKQCYIAYMETSEKGPISIVCNKSEWDTEDGLTKMSWAFIQLFEADS